MIDVDCKYSYFSADCRTYEINIYDLFHKIFSSENTVLHCPGENRKDEKNLIQAETCMAPPLLALASQLMGASQLPHLLSHLLSIAIQRISTRREMISSNRAAGLLVS